MKKRKINFRNLRELIETYNCKKLDEGREYVIIKFEKKKFDS